MNDAACTTTGYMLVAGVIHDAFNWMKLREIMHETEFDQTIK
jgi:hypothetical protein